MFDLIGNLEALLLSFGYVLLFGMIFAESGLFFGFFFPGDSLLFAAGVLAGKGFFDIHIVWFGTTICAIAGDQVGYWTGAKFGKDFFNKPGSFFRDPKHIQEAEDFYNKHGKKTIVLARFVPAVRTFAPIVAGIAKMDYREFVFYNVTGGILWTTLFVFAGYFIGVSIPNAGDTITLVMLAIIVLSLVPLALQFLKKKK